MVVLWGIVLVCFGVGVYTFYHYVETNPQYEKPLAAFTTGVTIGTWAILLSRPGLAVFLSAVGLFGFSYFVVKALKNDFASAWRRIGFIASCVIMASTFFAAIIHLSQAQETEAQRVAADQRRELQKQHAKELDFNVGALHEFRKAIVEIPSSLIKDTKIVTIDGAPHRLRIEVTNQWLSYHKQERLQMAQTLIEAWITITQSKGVNVEIVDWKGNELAGYGMFGGVWTK